MFRIGRATTAIGLAAALAAVGCTSRSTRLQMEAKDAKILELTERNHALDKELTQAREQLRALGELQSRPAPAPAPIVEAPKAAPTIEISAPLRKKGVQTVTRDGQTAILLPGAILFASGQTTLSKEAKTTLKQVVELLDKQFPGGRIRIEGHTDSDPIRRTKNLYKNNTELSEARAKAVRDCFVKECKVDEARLETVGHGEAKPIADNKTAAGKRQNRRVELVLLP
jgi:flagellar motor protein MotB